MIFRRWFIIRSKWFVSFIQRGNNKIIPEDKQTMKTIRAIRWWTKKNEYQKDWNGEGWIYALMCTKSADWYIGSTNRSLEERLKEHIYEANRVWEKEKMKRTAVHKAIWRTGINNWIIIPLVRQTEENQLRLTEEKLIRKMKPNLNRQKKKVEEKKSSRKRPPKKMREKKEKRITESKNLICKWSWDDTETINFMDTIKDKERKIIVWEQGTIDCTNWKEIEEKFYIAMKIDGKPGGIRELKSSMKNNKVGNVKIIQIIERDKIWEEKLKEETKKDLTKMPVEYLIKLWRKRKYLKNTERTRVTKRINKELKRREVIIYPKELVIRVARYENIKKSKIYEEIHQWISNQEIPKQWKKFLREEIKVVIVKNRTVGEILLNYRKWAKEDWFKISRCTCQITEKGRGESEHEIWKLEEKEPLFHQLTTKTVINPNGRKEKRMSTKELNQLHEIVSRIGPINRPTILPITYKNSRMEDEITKIKNKWNGWIFLERDKNNGAIAVACPMWYRKKLIETFDWTKWRANYQKINKDRNSVLKYWKEEVKKKKIKTGWNPKGMIPYCYGLPKEKDLNKMRPIVSYVHHPMKRIFNYIGRIILFMTKKSGIEGLTLWRVSDTEKRLKLTNELIDEWREEEDIEIKMEVYDVKEMYTCLPHNIILDAVNWVIETYKRKYGHLVTITGNRTEDIKVGKHNSKKNRTFSTDEIIEVVRQDLKNAVFSCGKLLVLQTIGIPMGSPLSPALAITTCAMAEEKMKRSITQNIHFQAMRYMDDMWICLMKNKKEEWGRTEEIFNHYDRHLKIEKEREGNRVRFLDKELIWNGREITQIAFNKNKDSLKEEGKRKFKNMLPQISFNTRETKKSLIVGKMIRIQTNTTKEVDTFWQGWICLKELEILGYKKNIVRECCGWLDTRYKKRIWRLLFEIYMMVGNNFMSLPSFSS